MMILKSTLVILAVIVTIVRGRPQEVADEDPAIRAALDQVSETGTTLFEAASSTGQTLADEVRQMVFDFWTAGAQAILGVNTAVRETAVSALQGVRDTVGAMNEFVKDSVRTGGQMGAGVVTTGLNVSRDAIGATREFVSGVTGTAVKGFSNAANAAANFIEDSAANAGEFNNAANSVGRRVVVSGIERFTNQ